MAQSKVHLPGEPGIWVFVIGDLFVFGLFFCTFIYYRAHDLAVYARSQALLNQDYGAVNTIFLLTSSLCVVLAVQGLRSLRRTAAQYYLAGAILFGLAFVAIKIIEYHDKFAHGIVLTTNDFFMFYFMLTGLHLVHVLIGLSLLALMWRRTRGPARPGEMVMFESCATFWHMVDILWLVLFPLIYLIK